MKKIYRAVLFLFLALAASLQAKTTIIPDSFRTDAVVFSPRLFHMEQFHDDSAKPAGIGLKSMVEI